MIEENQMNQKSLEVLGEGYKKACAMKVTCYKLAGFIGGRELDIYRAGLTVIDQLDHMTDFQIGVMLGIDWGLDVPGDLIAKADLTFRLPGNIDIH